MKLDAVELFRKVDMVTEEMNPNQQREDSPTASEETQMDMEGGVRIHDDDPRITRVGFAKIDHTLMEGANLPAPAQPTLYIRKYSVNLGRRSKSQDNDVDLGDSMNISRQHASICYNFQKGHWELFVKGKNGLFHNRKPAPYQSPPIRLRSGDMIHIAAHVLTWTEAQRQ